MSQTVLLLDDELDERTGVRALLEPAGFDVVDVDTGRRALHYLTSTADDPSLIVTDLAMPDMSGWEFIGILQAYVRLSLIPLFVVSGVEQQRTRIRLGAVREWFRKPLDADRFIDLARRHARPAAPPMSGAPPPLIIGRS